MMTHLQLNIWKMCPNVSSLWLTLKSVEISDKFDYFVFGTVSLPIAMSRNEVVRPESHRLVENEKYLGTQKIIQRVHESKER